MEFWSDRIVERSWGVLLELRRKFDFVLIGGWAAYLHTGAIRSKDIDIVLDFEALTEFKNTYKLKKNQQLKKYEAVVREVSVDIYVSYFSKLPIPAEDLKSYAMIIEGIRVLTPETLLILKQNAEKDRSHSIKGQKDRVDILNLLVNGNINLRKYKRILDKYTLENYAKRLLKITRSMRKEFSYLGIDNPRKVKLVKKDLVNRIREI